MTRLKVPLIGRKTVATGDIVLRAELDLLLRDQGDALRPVTVRADTATDMSTSNRNEVIAPSSPH